MKKQTWSLLEDFILNTDGNGTYWIEEANCSITFNRTNGVEDHLIKNWFIENWELDDDEYDILQSELEEHVK